MGTDSVARDLESIRQALGEAQINYYGASYGTLLGERYLALFPKNARAVVRRAKVVADLVGGDQCIDEAAAAALTQARAEAAPLQVERIARRAERAGDGRRHRSGPHVGARPDGERGRAPRRRWRVPLTLRGAVVS